ncbi:unnamed protein product [Blepharisma stoltei]|uniref:RRM domain-containing protein n=1 Tax=Blepharisma stoltei TaxID=1481888 RepID=A0AAU9KIS0_9CILI|nr:unnamed protein product [Blepharisma stoltei]
MFMSEQRSSEEPRQKIFGSKEGKAKKSLNKKFPKKTISPPEFKSDPSSPLSGGDSNKVLPIPHGDNPYSKAKQAEYKDRDYKKAEFYYKQAINQGDRVESAVKDLASLLHQRGKTAEACKLLEENRGLFMNNYEKYQNLYNTIYKQLDETTSSLSRILKVSGLGKDDSSQKVTGLFNNSSRILEVVMGHEEEDGDINYYAFLRFNSHSSARKALEAFRNWTRHRVEWVTKTGEIIGDAHYARHKMEEYRKANPTFDYIIFDRDPKGYVLSLPIDGHSAKIKEELPEGEVSIRGLLGTDLYDSIFNYIDPSPISSLRVAEVRVN